MRMFEATGCGALLLTDIKQNIYDFFTPDQAVMYESPADAVYKIRSLLDVPEKLNWIAQNGQWRTLREHTYGKRMKTVSAKLTEML